MPDIDGWAVLRALKADPELREIPVILVTMLGDARWASRSAPPSISTKPIDPQELLRAARPRLRAARSAADVLVVDDDPATRDVLRRTLIQEGWTVARRTNGAEGLAELAAAKPASSCST